MQKDTFQKTRLIMMRHGESLWNHQNLFTGWVDVSLSPKGIQEALEGGKKIADLPIDIVYTSQLSRALMTALLALSVHTSNKTPTLIHERESAFRDWGKVYSESSEKGILPIFTAWELNERMYGELQGKNKQEMRNLYGEEQVKIWRRSFDAAPPKGESLKMTAERTLPYFLEVIKPQLDNGKSVFISAHGNSLRAILMHLENLTEEQVVSVEVPTGVPIIYEKTPAGLKKKDLF